MKKIVFLLLILSSSALALMNMSLDEPYEGITSNSVIEIVYDSSGIWLGTAGGASYLADGETSWRTFRGNSGLHSKEVSALAASVYNGTTYVCIATLHTEEVSGENIPVGDGFSITTDGGETWLPDSVSQPGNATYFGKLSYDLDMYQNDIYSATFYGGLVYSMDGGNNWDNLYLNDIDSTDLVDSTFRSYSNRYFSVKVDTTLAPDTISVFAGTAFGINRFIFTDYGDGLKQDAAWQIGYSLADSANSLPGNHVVALATTGEPGRIYDVFIVGDRAYVAHDQKGLYVVNIYNPDSPNTIGFYEGINLGKAHGVYVSGDYAYVADYAMGLRIFDITGNSPAYVSSFSTGEATHDVFVLGDYAYVANHLSSVTIVNVSDPANPVQESQYMDYGGINGVHVVGDYAYLAAGDDGFVIVDVSDPANPVQIGIDDSLGFANEVFIDNNLAYIADDVLGLVVLDITDPDSLSRVDMSGMLGDAKSVYFENDLIYVADDLAMRVYELAADTLAYLGFHDTPGTATNVVVEGNYAFVADNYHGLQIYDVLMPGSILTEGNFAPVCSSYIWAGCRVGVGEAAQDYAVAYTTDYGNHWKTVIHESAWDFAFIGDTVLVATDNGLYISDDYENWEVITEIEDVSGLSKYFPSGFFCVETVGSEIWAGGADGTIHSADGENWNVFRSQLYEDEHFAYPSPFSPVASTRRGATIHYKPIQTTDVTIKIFDFNLDLVTTIIDGASRTGGMEADNDVWDGKNDNGKMVANGVYFYNIKLGTGEDWWGKVAVIK
ncbi:MAG: hypothetical protein GY839_16955 [candidate division Zixibacteria bacterium]|nr:hypothetical protein [candidate division Zixibacteria bacterium]